MGYLNFDESITRTDARGVEHVAIVCTKCGGRGYLPGYEHVDNARCWDCGGRRGPIGWRTREEYERIIARRKREEERRIAKARAEAEKRASELLDWRLQHRELVEALDAYRGSNEFLRDMQIRMDSRPLTDKMVEAIEKTFARDAEKAASDTDVPAGRQVVGGRVLSVKSEIDQFSYQERYIVKMLVDCGGYRVYGTMPSGLDAEKGDLVEFTATLQPKELGFGFFKRPAKAKKLGSYE